MPKQHIGSNVLVLAGHAKGHRLACAVQVHAALGEGQRTKPSDGKHVQGAGGITLRSAPCQPTAAARKRIIAWGCMRPLRHAPAPTVLCSACMGPCMQAQGEEGAAHAAPGPDPLPAGPARSHQVSAWLLRAKRMWAWGSEECDSSSKGLIQ